MAELHLMGLFVVTSNILKCLSIGTPNASIFHLSQNEKLMFFLGVPVFKHIVMRL